MIKALDLRENSQLHPLIVAIDAILLSPKGSELTLIMDSEQIFKSIKEYLIYKNIGFREIYDDNIITLQFKIK